MCLGLVEGRLLMELGAACGFKGPEPGGGGSSTAGCPGQGLDDLKPPGCWGLCRLRLALAPELHLNSYPAALPQGFSFLLSAPFPPPRPVAVVTSLGQAQRALEHFTTALPQSHSNH